MLAEGDGTFDAGVPFVIVVNVGQLGKEGKSFGRSGRN